MAPVLHLVLDLGSRRQDIPDFVDKFLAELAPEAWVLEVIADIPKTGLEVSTLADKLINGWSHHSSCELVPYGPSDGGSWRLR